jgi:hypothetical protein
MAKLGLDIYKVPPKQLNTGTIQKCDAKKTSGGLVRILPCAACPARTARNGKAGMGASRAPVWAFWSTFRTKKMKKTDGDLEYRVLGVGLATSFQPS